MTRFAALGSLLALLGAGSGSAAVRTGVVTLVETRAPITAFAQDGRRLVWATTAASGCAAVFMRDLRLDSETRLSSPLGPTCRAGFGGTPQLALGGIRAIWSLRRGPVVSVATAAPDTAGDLIVSRRVGGDVVAMSGDGTPLVYGWTGPRGGGIDYVDGRRIVAMRAAPVPELLALNGGRVAVVVRGRPRVVQIRFLHGALERSIHVRGDVLAVALSPTMLGVLYDTDGARRLDGYALSTGERRTSHAVSRETAPRLSMSDERVLFRVRRSVRLLRLDRPADPRTVALLGEHAHGVSIEADRVAWAENAPRTRRGYVRAVFVRS